jgi:hypothetical protein
VMLQLFEMKLFRTALLVSRVKRLLCMMHEGFRPGLSSPMSICNYGATLPTMLYR